MKPTKIEQFIELVRSHPELYDLSNENYENQRLKDDIWKDIASSLNFETADSAKEEWKNLRDCYEKAKKKMQNCSGSCREASKTWSYLPLPKFLDDYSEIIHHDSNLTQNVESQEDDIDGALDEIDFDHDSINISTMDETIDSPCSTCSSINSESRTKKRFRKDSVNASSTNSISELLVALKNNIAERQEIIDKQQQKKDDLKYFFLLMTEIVAKLKPYNQRRAKIQTLKLVSEIEEEEEAFLESEGITRTLPVTSVLPSAKGSESDI